MKRSVLAVVLAVLVTLSGCAALTGSQSDEQETTVPDEQVAVADNESGATNVSQTLRIAVNETTAGTELTEVGATYPRDRFAVDAAQHEDITLGVDTDGDGELDRRFNETHVSGVNNNEYSFDIALDTEYTLQEGDVVVVGYPSVDNPTDTGDYEVLIRLNDQQNSTGTVTIE